MLKAVLHPDFKKDFKKMHNNIKEAFAMRFLFFLQSPQNPLLHDHSLTGKLKGKRAFSVAGDCRVIYRYFDEKTIILLRIGTHNQVY